MNDLPERFRLAETNKEKENDFLSSPAPRSLSLITNKYLTSQPNHGAAAGFEIEESVYRIDPFTEKKQYRSRLTSSLQE